MISSAKLFPLLYLRPSATCSWHYTQGRCKGQASSAAARGAELQRALRRRLNNWKYGAGKFSISKNERISPKNYPPFWHAPSKISASPVLTWKLKKNVYVGLKWGQNISLPWAPTCILLPLPKIWSSARISYILANRIHKTRAKHGTRR